MSESASSQSRRKTERLLSLMLLLADKGRPVSRAEIFEAFPEHYPDASAATQRKFERDKKELREIVEIDITGDPADAESQSYSIDKQRVQESELVLTGDEAAVVAVAVHQAYEPQEARALTIVTDGLVAAGEHAGFARDVMHISPLPSQLQALMRAYLAAAAVSFDYRKPGSEQQERRSLDIWGIVAHNGHWYIGGWDHDKEAARVFRLDRIMSAVDLGGRATHRRPEDYNLVKEVMHEPTSYDTGTVLIRKGKALRLRQRATKTENADGDWDLLTLDCRDIEATAGLVARFGTDAVAQTPDELRVRVMARLATAAGVLHE